MQLTTNSVKEYWSEQNGELFRLLEVMASAETWPLDDAEADAWLIDLGDALGDDSAAQCFADNKQAAIELSVYLSTPTALRVLNRVDECRPGTVRELLDRAADGISDNPLFNIFVERLEIIGRHQLLQSVFSDERFQSVSQAIKTVRGSS